LFLVPGKPLNVSIGDVNDSTIALSWSEPENPNGVIKGYRIYFMRKNFTDVQTVRNGEKFQKFILTDLGKFYFNSCSTRKDFKHFSPSL
jgi:hypothetical protein